MPLRECIEQCLLQQSDPPMAPGAMWITGTGLALASLVRMQPNLVTWMAENGFDIDSGGDCALAVLAAFNTRPDSSGLQNIPATVG